MKRLASRGVFALGLGLALFLAAPASAPAGQASDDMFISANVVAACTSVVAQALDFGDYASSANAPVKDVNADVTVTCTDGTNFLLDADGGLNFANGVRHMGGGQNPDFLGYNLYTDAPGGTVFGTGAGGFQMSLNNSLAPIPPFTIHGRIFANQNVAAGVYSDTVVITVSF